VQLKDFGDKFNNLLIIGATSNADRRGMFENKFVEALTNENIVAIPSYKLIFDIRELSRKVVSSAIVGKDFDGVLVTRLVNMTQEEIYIRPTERDENLNYFTYTDNALRASEPGYSAEFNVLTLETNVYDIFSGLLVWSLRTRAPASDNPPSEAIHAQIKLTIDTLRSRGLIEPRP
jgi:hypothetical protein